MTDYGLRQTAAYIVMERCAKNARRTDRLEGPLTLQEIVAIIVPVCRALACAHADGIVHRDVKPDNIFLTDRGNGRFGITVLDFGIAKAPLATGRVTKHGQSIGSPHYMAPEACRGEDVDHRVDIYSVGVLMYLLFTGRVPFHDENFLKLLQMQVLAQPTPPRDLEPAIPPAIEAVIRAYGPEVVSYLAGVMRASDDDVGEVFGMFCEYVCRGIPGFRSESSVRTWAYVIARRAGPRSCSTSAVVRAGLGAGVRRGSRLLIVLLPVAAALVRGGTNRDDSPSRRPRSPRTHRLATAPAPAPTLRHLRRASSVTEGRTAEPICRRRRAQRRRSTCGSRRSRRGRDRQDRQRRDHRTPIEQDVDERESAKLEVSAEAPRARAASSLDSDRRSRSRSIASASDGRCTPRRRGIPRSSKPTVVRPRHRRRRAEISRSETIAE